ncbi:MAG: phosphate acyltransferase PlsX [Ruminococcaceae bacterium]|nr:phosphate acyltransferase PlsX [Oscillospiraceae bacterium]
MMVLVDAMGGDNAPAAIVKGCVDALNTEDDFSVTLIGDRPSIEKVLVNEKYDKNRLFIRHTSEVITNDDSPTKAIRSKPDSSLVVGFNMLKEKEGDVFISAGSSGALLAASVMILKRIKGVERPAVGSVIPTKKGKLLLLDSGLNHTCRSSHYVQFGYLGAAYMKSAFGVENPRVGLINIGTEDEKGTDVVREANVMLRESRLNYVGNIESRDLFDGITDIAVTDGFTGNVVLKLIEGASSFFVGELKSLLFANLKSKMAALMLKKGLDGFKRKIDADVNGGAPILGIDGLVIKSHGSSKARTIKYVVLKAKVLAASSFIEDLKHDFLTVPKENPSENAEA